MLSRPPFADEVIVNALRDKWALNVDEVSYAPVGYGSWHWYVGEATHRRLFVTVDEIAPAAAAATTTRPSLAELDWAYRVPLSLSQAGLGLARPPIPTASGEVLASAEDTWVISVWPYLDGRATHDGTYSSQDDVTAVLAILGDLHATAPTSFGDRATRRDTFCPRGLARLLELVDKPWPGPYVGPYAAEADQLLHDHAEDIRNLAASHDQLARTPPPISEWVVTHGEPHNANVVFTADGPVLIDWDTAMLAPKERDLWMLAADGFSVGEVERGMLSLYRAQWDLSELFDYAQRFADPEDDGPEGERAWDDFVSYIRRAAST